MITRKKVVKSVMKNYYSNVPTIYMKYDTDVTTVEIIYSTM